MERLAGSAISAVHLEMKIPPGRDWGEKRHFWLMCRVIKTSLAIDHLHNGDRFKYSFVYILISLLVLIQVQRFYSITDLFKSVAIMHTLCKWSIILVKSLWDTKRKPLTQLPVSSY